MRPFLGCRAACTTCTTAFNRVAKAVIVLVAAGVILPLLLLPAAQHALASQAGLLLGNLTISPGLLSVLSAPDEESATEGSSSDESSAERSSVEKRLTSAVAISFRLAFTATVIIEIRDEAGVVVKELLTPTELEPGPHSFTWDGKDTSGAPVPGGTYLIVLRAYGLGGGFEEKTGKLTVRTARSLELNGYKSFQYRGSFINGNAGAFSGGPPGSSLEQALALDAEGYATPQIYIRGSYDDSEGPSLRQFMVAYEGERVRASAGDLTVGYPEQEFTLRERSVFGGQIGGDMGNNSLDLILARVDATSAVLRYKGDGITVTYWLNAPVIPGSERISVNNRQLTRDVDYVIDYGSGELALWRPVPYDEELVVVYEYLPEHKFYRQDLFGVRSRTKLSEGTEFAFNAVRLGDELTPVGQPATPTGTTTATPTLPPPSQLWNYDLNGKTRLWGGDLILAGEWAESLYNRDWRDTSFLAASGEPGTAYRLRMDLARGKLNLDGSLRRIDPGFQGVAAGDLQAGVDALSLGGEYQAWPYLGFVSQYSARAVFPVAGLDTSAAALVSASSLPTTSTQPATGSTLSATVGSRLKLAKASQMPANFPEIEVSITRSLRSPQPLPLPALLAQPFPLFTPGDQSSSPFDTWEEGVELGIHQSAGKLAYAVNLARGVETSQATANPDARTKWSASLGTQFQPAESLVIASKYATQRKFGSIAAGSYAAPGQANGAAVSGELVRREDMDLSVKFSPGPGLSTTAGLEAYLTDDRETGLNNKWTAARLSMEKALSENLYAGMGVSQQKRWSRQDRTIAYEASSTDGLSNEVTASLRYGRLAKLSGAIRQKNDQTWAESGQETGSGTSLSHDVALEYSPKSGTSFTLERRDSQEEPGSDQPGGQITWILRGSAQARPGLTFKTSLEATSKNTAAQTQTLDRNFSLGATYSAGAGVQLSAGYKWASRADFMYPDKGFIANVINLGVIISF
ncbi:MAG: FlgD immunoglobulin-like domain containing protein [Syntrophothermus sp.]